MKIVMVSLQFEQTATGGGGVHVKHICNEFLKMEQDVTILSIHTEKTLPGAELLDWDVPYSVEKRENFTVVRLLIDKGIEQPYVGHKDVELERIKRFADSAVKWLKERPEEFDIINLHGHHLLPGYMAKELQGMKPKVISYLHALETTYVTEKGDFVGAFEGTADVLGRIVEWEAMCRYADYIMVNSPIVGDEIKGIISKFDPDIDKYSDKIILLASGCDEDFLMSDEEVDNKLKDVPDIINLITFCRIDPSKGVEYSIIGAKAAAEKSSYKFCLTIAGIPASTEYIDKLKKEADNVPENLEVKFRLLDAISPADEKKDILDREHIYILPTLKEPFGMSVIEASARGIMAISADTNGPKFMFESDKGIDKDWGIITDRGVLAKITDDHHANFADNVGTALVWMVDNWDDSHKRVITFNKKIRSTWTWEGIAKQYLELFNR